MGYVVGDDIINLNTENLKSGTMDYEKKKTYIHCIMQSIKSYTDIEQSKKLVEILPIESADMYWKNAVSDKYIQCFTPFIIDDIRSNVDFDYDIPCWSLAALLGVLPKRIELEGVAYELSIYLNGLYYWNVNNGNLLLEVKGKDNLVDACVDMIIKLSELNLL